eukprot:gb/GECH01001789.1/.p1 GENE.gb/GECH01001789.1/~~gb/GECH01001789.1/.p1  ORF type:complete len:875 (+),score=175.20 gb/GECH01001789.1/:1-2625(+)
MEYKKEDNEHSHRNIENRNLNVNSHHIKSSSLGRSPPSQITLDDKVGSLDVAINKSSSSRQKSKVFDEIFKKYNQKSSQVQVDVCNNLEQLLLRKDGEQYTKLLDTSDDTESANILRALLLLYDFHGVTLDKIKALVSLDLEKLDASPKKFSLENQLSKTLNRILHLYMGSNFCGFLRHVLSSPLSDILAALENEERQSQIAEVQEWRSGSRKPRSHSRDHPNTGQDHPNSHHHHHHNTSSHNHSNQNNLNSVNRVVKIPKPTIRRGKRNPNTISTSGSNKSRSKAPLSSSSSSSSSSTSPSTSDTTNSSSTSRSGTGNVEYTSFSPEAVSLRMAETAASLCLDRILRSAYKCPPEMRSLCLHLYCATEAVYPSSGMEMVGELLFHRFFCPAIIFPEQYKMGHSTPSPASRKVLVTVSKIFQKLAKGLEFQTETSSYHKLNSFIAAHAKSVKTFIHAILREDLSLPDYSKRSSSIIRPRQDQREGAIGLLLIVLRYKFLDMPLLPSLPQHHYLHLIRAEKMKRALRQTRSRDAYVTTAERYGRVVVPLDWVRFETSGEVGGEETEWEDVSYDQLQKDSSRDAFTVNGELFQNQDVTVILKSIKKLLLKHQHAGSPREASAMGMGLLKACGRTMSGAHSLDAVHYVFGGPETVMVLADSLQVPPVHIDIGDHKIEVQATTGYRILDEEAFDEKYSVWLRIEATYCREFVGGSTTVTCECYSDLSPVSKDQMKKLRHAIAPLSTDSILNVAVEHAQERSMSIADIQAAINTSSSDISGSFLETLSGGPDEELEDPPDDTGDDNDNDNDFDDNIESDEDNGLAVSRSSSTGLMTQNYYSPTSDVYSSETSSSLTDTASSHQQYMNHQDTFPPSGSGD